MPRSMGELDLFILGRVCFHLVVIVTCAALNLGVQAFVSTPDLCSLGHVVILFHF